MLRFPLPLEGGIEDELISAYSTDFPQTIILSNRKVGPIIKLTREDYNFDNNNFTIYFTLTDFTLTCKLENPRKFAACSDRTREKSYWWEVWCRDRQLPSNDTFAPGNNMAVILRDDIEVSAVQLAPGSSLVYEMNTINPLANPKGVKLLCELCQKPAFLQCTECRVTYYW